MTPIPLPPDGKSLFDIPDSQEDSEAYWVIDPCRFTQEVDDALSSSQGKEYEQLMYSLISSKKKGQPTNVKESIAQLRQLKNSAPNMADFIEAIAGQLMLHCRFGVKKPLKFVPTLLVGPPGLGKTYIASRVAECLGIWHGQIRLALATESFVLSGCPRGYGTATPGDLARRMATADCINPLLILDELDKACYYPHERPPISGPLLQALEPESAKTFEDACLKCEMDLSHVSWLATANNLEGVPEPVLSRFHIIHIEEPEAGAKARQMQQITNVLLEEMGLAGKLQVEVTPEAIADHIYLSVRSWRMKLQLAIALKSSATKGVRTLLITSEDFKRLTREHKKMPMGFIHT